MKLLVGHKPVYYTGAGNAPNLSPRDLLARPVGDVLILDTETTGFTGEVIELAIINLAGDVLYQSRFLPSMVVEAAAILVHGLTYDMLRHEPLFTDQCPVIRDVLDKALIHLAYNAPFDVARLDFTCKHYRLAPLPLRPQCLMKLRGQRLPLKGGDHSALGDCRKALELLKELARG